MPLHHIKKHKKKSIAIGLIGTAVLGYFLFIRKPTEVEILTVTRGDFLQQVSVSGKVAATENVDLSFEQAGIVRGVYAKVGDSVTVGKFIASQDTAQLYAQADQMQAGIDLQKAKLNQFLAGSSPEDIKIKEDATAAAKQDLTTSYDSALAALNTAYNAIYNSYTLATYMQNTYFAGYDQSGIKVLDARTAIANSLADAKTNVDNGKASQDSIDTAITNISADLNTTYAYLKIIRDQCEEGVYAARVLAADKTSLDTQRASINTSLTSVASSKQSIASYKAALQLAQNQLQAIKAPPRPTDTAVYDAQIKQAEASLQEIYAQIRKRQIITPIAGIIAAVNAKVGSIAGSSQVAVSIISNGKFQIDSFVPEIYISLVRPGNQAEITLDAYGQDKKFAATVVAIDPSQNQKDGVSTYKTTLQFVGDDNGAKDGMSANVVIIVSKKEKVISVPQGLVMVKYEKKFVKVQQGKNVIEKEVQTGEVSFSGQVEIVSGLKEGDILPLN